MKKLILVGCMLTLAACSSNDDSDATDANIGEMDNGEMMVPANPEAIFVTPDMIEFQETLFPGVSLALAFSNETLGSHETFVQVAAGGAIPPHMHTEGTYSKDVTTGIMRLF